jgi:hypothetical protein
VTVAAGIVACPTSEQVVGRHVQGLAPQVPKGDVDGRHGGTVNMSAAEELALPQRLPDVLDAAWIHAD